MADRHISVVVLDAVVTGVDDGPSPVKISTAFRRIFGFTPAIQLQKDSGTKYQAGNVRGYRSPPIVSAQVTPLRSMSEVEVTQNNSEGFVFAEEEDPVTVSEAVASIVLFPQDDDKGVLAVWERSSFPYTRLLSFVRAANRHHADSGWELHLKPRIVTRRLKEWIAHFDKIREMRFDYRHSQSPGDEFIDETIEQINAGTISEVVTAPEGEFLNKRKIHETRFKNTIDHLDMNKKNGTATISGLVGGDAVQVDTKNAVERHRIAVASTHYDTVVAGLMELLSTRR